jgi:hypothetical protein
MTVSVLPQWSLINAANTDHEEIFVAKEVGVAFSTAT